MAPQEFRHGLEDILSAIEGIQQATTDKTFADYTGNWVLKHAVQRGVEIISEASRLLPPEIQALRPEISWSRVRGIGNILRHEYHSLSARLIWGVVVDELPLLKTAISNIQIASGKADSS